MPGFFSNTLAVLRREIYRVARQPMYWLLTVILPIVAFAFFAVLLYKGVARDIPIAVVDQDNSTLSRKVTQMIDATPTAWVAYGVQGMEEAERLMLQGKVMGIVLIPDFFEKNILNNSQTHLESYLTGTNITVNGLLAKDLQTTVTTFTAGIQLQLLMKQGLTEKQAMAQLMPVRFDKHVLFNPHINYGYYLSPSFMPMMLLIFTIMATIFVIGTELKNGTAREWYDTAGGSVFAAYAGKILPITVIMFLMSELMLLVIFKVVGVPLNGSLTVITISNLLFILSYQSLGAMIVTVLSNLRLSLSIGGGYSVLAFTFSGLTFPIMAMSKPMQWFCCIFPFTFYTDIMVDQALRRVEQFAPVAFDRRRLLGTGLHVFGPYVPDYGYEQTHAMVLLHLSVHILHRHHGRSGPARCSGDILVARHGHHRPVHHSSAAVSAAPAHHLHE